MTEPILKAQNLVKRYGRVTALDHCNFELMPGEIIAVIGDNGAGKSTLIKAISGAVVPDSGEVFLEGQRVNFSSPLEARERGIETVYQTLAMSPALSIADHPLRPGADCGTSLARCLSNAAARQSHQNRKPGQKTKGQGSAVSYTHLTLPTKA